MARPHGKPVLITTAEKSPDQQLHDRKVRYVAMMSLRIVLIVLATILFLADAPLLWLWIPLCVAGGALLPWMAVLIANDRPPKQENLLRNRLRRRRSEPEAPRELAPRKNTVLDPDE